MIHNANQKNKKEKEKFFFFFGSLLAFYTIFLFAYYSLFEYTNILEIGYFFPHLAFILVFAGTAYILDIPYAESCTLRKQNKKDESLYSYLKNIAYFTGLTLCFAFGFNMVVMAIISCFDYSTSVPVFFSFLLTCVYSLFFFVYGHYFKKYNESPYICSSGVRKLIVFFKYYYAFDKPWASFTFILGVLTFIRCVPYFLVILTVTSMRFNHLLYVSAFYLFSLILTFVVYLPEVQYQLKTTYGENCLRLLGWNAAKLFAANGGKTIMVLVGTAVVGGGINHVGSTYATRENSRYNDQQYKGALKEYFKLKEEFPHTNLQITVPVRKPDREINIMGEFFGVVGKSLRIEPRPQPKPPKTYKAPKHKK